jgi:anti-anti-sigma factor
MSLFEVQEAELRPDCRVIELKGELDLAVAGQLEEALERARDFRLVLIDLDRCEFLDSTGIAIFVRAHTESRREGRVVAAVRATGQVLRVLSITGLTQDGLFFESAEQALEALGPSTP